MEHEVTVKKMSIGVKAEEGPIFATFNKDHRSFCGQKIKVKDLSDILDKLNYHAWHKLKLDNPRMRETLLEYPEWFVRKKKTGGYLVFHSSWLNMEQIPEKKKISNRYQILKQRNWET